MAYGRLSPMVSLGVVVLALGCSKRPTGDGAPEPARDGVGIRPSASGNAAELRWATPSANASAVAAPAPSAAPVEAKAWAPETPVAPVVAVSGLAGYSDVTLPALGAELRVPDALVAKRAPNRLSTEDGSASIEFTELPPSKSLSDLYAEATRKNPGSGRSISYKKQTDDWFVVSGLAGSAIYYEKTTRLEGRILRFSFRFPAVQKKEYDEDTAYMASSFRALGAPGPELPKGRCYSDSECPKGYHCPPNGFCTINWGDE